jgi:hypothetical protein
MLRETDELRQLGDRFDLGFIYAFGCHAKYV